MGKPDTADGNGAIDVNGQVSPVTYTVSLKQGTGRSYEVDIRLMAPRAFPSITTMAGVTTMAIITMAVSMLPTRSRSN